MSIARALALNTGVQIVGKVISTVIGVVVVGLMTRLLGQVGFGMYSTANAFLQFFAIMLDFGLNVTLVQMLGEHAGDTIFENRVVRAAFSLRIFSALILLGIAPIIGLAFPYPWELKLAIFGIWASFFTTSLNQIVIGVQQRHLKMHIVAIGEVAGRLVLLAGVVTAYVLHWGLLPIVLIVSVGSTANFLINILVAKGYADFGWHWDPAFWKTLLIRSWPIGVSILFNLIYYKADTLILSLTRSQAEVGIYGAAYRVLDILVTVPFMYAGVLLPIIAKLWAQGQRERFSRILSHSFDVMVLLAAPLVAGTIVLGTRGMVLVAGKDFATSGAVLQILMLAAAIIFFGTISSHVVVALNIQRKMIPIYIATAIVTLIGYLVFIPLYGMWAAAWLTVFSELCVAIGSTALCLTASHTCWIPTASLKAAFAAIVMALAILPFQHMNLFVAVAVGAAVYVVLVFATKAVSKETVLEIVSFRRPDTPVLDNPLE